MSDTSANAGETDRDHGFTLDPPGRIAVVGAGPIGVECALYGRYLGYDVLVIEADAVGGALKHQDDQPLPMMPDRCLSPLAIAAIEAQSESAVPTVLPLTIGQWIDQGLQNVMESDLLAGRICLPCRCVSIELAPLQPGDPEEAPSEEDDEMEEVPPDYRLTLAHADGTASFETVEAVVLTVGREHDIELRFPRPAPYFFHLVEQRTGDVEKDLHRGWREIVATFASLMGRPQLDLYRPRRV